MASFLAWTSQVVLAVLGLFLIIVILLQRGRGGGLAGAFGGMGGQSAFGTKAGDVFTKITIVIAIIWVIVAGGSGFLLRAAADQYASQFPEKQATSDTKTADPAVPEAKPSASDVPARPEPPAGATGDAAGSKSATPAESTAVPESSPGDASTAPATSEPAATPANPEPAAATPAATEPATPAPTDGASNPEPQ